MLSVILGGYSELQVVTNGQAYLDNLEITIVDTGSLQVTMAPTNAVNAGAQWQVDGGAWQNHGNTVSGLSLGNHTVAYKPASGWNPPSNQTVVVFAGNTTVTNGVYTPQTGSLLVTISPAGAESAGAQWRVDGGSWQNSGAMVGGLSPGYHWVSYSFISNWITPPDQGVVVAADATATAIATHRTRRLMAVPPPSGSLAPCAPAQPARAPGPSCSRRPPCAPCARAPSPLALRARTARDTARPAPRRRRPP
mgnify:CR=1 FL=1